MGSCILAHCKVDALLSIVRQRTRVQHALLIIIVISVNLRQFVVQSLQRIKQLGEEGWVVLEVWHSLMRIQQSQQPAFNAFKILTAQGLMGREISVINLCAHSVGMIRRVPTRVLSVWTGIAKNVPMVKMFALWGKHASLTRTVQTFLFHSVVVH